MKPAKKALNLIQRVEKTSNPGQETVDIATLRKQRLKYKEQRAFLKKIKEVRKNQKQTRKAVKMLKGA